MSFNCLVSVYFKLSIPVMTCAFNSSSSWASCSGSYSGGLVLWLGHGWPSIPGTMKQYGPLLANLHLLQSIKINRVFLLIGERRWKIKSRSNALIKTLSKPPTQIVSNHNRTTCTKYLAKEYLMLTLWPFPIHHKKNSFIGLMILTSTHLLRIVFTIILWRMWRVGLVIFCTTTLFWS